MRGETFVTRKITRAASRIKYGLEDTLYLGNLEAKRDWGHARDYVEGMWRIVQQDTPDDFVLGTGELHSVRDFVESAFKHAGMTIEWSGAGTDEIGVDSESGKTIVKIDPRYFRPAEVELLLADPSKAEKVLGWQATTLFDDLVKEMMEHDMAETAKLL
jgi:GDPmannose 4,6-dehydratase